MIIETRRSLNTREKVSATYFLLTVLWTT